ncbi:hypothetical protein [Actinoplanes sp. M2I2]|uniref:hypothetical protein n=1 Tax=Actinoplanes sp. M2I2 TaxID=1734444 RepID=UPI002020B183|nr:hypothetical protein [Actinoplanes sp. M2I2]
MKVALVKAALVKVALVKVALVKVALVKTWFTLAEAAVVPERATARTRDRSTPCAGMSGPSGW